MEVAVFVVAAVLILSGAVGVVASRNPVHAALFLVQTLLGVALLFLLQGADFLAAVQLVVYAGAVVVLFLFVIMLLGVDKAENLCIEPIAGQRPLAVIAGAVCAAALITVAMASSSAFSVARRFGGLGALDSGADAEDNGVTGVERLGQMLFRDHAFALEITAALLTVAVLGAVVLTRPRRGSAAPGSEKTSVVGESGVRLADSPMIEVFRRDR